MGKAYFVRKEHLDARYNFEYIIRQFPEEPIKYDAYLWLTRNFLEQRIFTEAKEKLDYIEAQKDFPRKRLSQFNVIYADYYLKQKQYEDAIPKLKKSIDNTRKRSDKQRYTFILAQIYEKMGNLSQASELYAKVKKRNNNYEMVFNANINSAKLAAMQGKNAKDIRKKLNRMLKDDKNIEYRDRIYYAIAEIDKSSGDIDNAIKNYKLSSETSVSNDYQKALSCLNLGEIYYAKLDYRNAQTYYDTTIMFLPTTFDNYNNIRSISLNLNELVKYTDIVSFEDSVQKLANMSTNERNKIIDKIIAELVEQERKQREEETLAMQNSMLFDQRRGSNSNVMMPTQSGKWYFYNQAQLSVGRNEFTKKWGNRKNEDNWRRRNKAIMADFDSNQLADNDSLAPKQKANTNIKSREYYLQDIPLTDSAMKASHAKITDALYNIGRIYKELFADYPKSINAYEDLNKRYPTNIYMLSAYYDLYLLNKLLNNTAEAEKYKNLIINNYPESNHAKLLLNPNYAQEVIAKEQADDQFYVNTYDKFMSGDYPAAARNINKFFNENDEKHPLASRFDFFKTLLVVKDGDTTLFKAALVNFIKKYNKDDLATVAQNILQYIGTTDIQAFIEELKARPEVTKRDNNNNFANNNNQNAENDVAEEQLFDYDTNAEHYYVIYVKTADTDMKRVAFEVRNFNIFNFSMRTFNVVNYPFNQAYELVTVRSFKNQRQASNYAKMIANCKEVSDLLKNANYKSFVISADNFTKLTTNKNINAYMKFFEKKY
jgi:tetratricopeptide (TPR) repeat protein